MLSVSIAKHFFFCYTFAVKIFEYSRALWLFRILLSFFFLTAVIPVTRSNPRPLRNAVLLFFSLLFYAWGEPVYMLPMLTAFNAMVP